ncbi:molybdenum cofactor synthesis domain-containing protein [Treponema sp. JC4]|uniref:MOSC domain-containing protein n=1 Tax=Treponema sp. JC4 TaxID=1124982 RepID=UPI00025B0D99|nr:MOSC domain-containing protein [Treponema sp. JC4]EID85788.1 molybdenum cofactor synthesis domain-containing protein [Treponema sp. JC4]
MKGIIRAVCISEKKGTPKIDIKSVNIIENFGLQNDAHAGSERQVSLLSWDKVEDFKKSGADVTAGDFGENLLIEGFDFKTFPVGTKFKCNDVILEIIQIGKKCHSACTVTQRTGKCIMPSEGVFARVLHGGKVSVGDEIELIEGRRFSASVLVASDRCSKGEREDKSGPVIKEVLEKAGYLVTGITLLPDDEEGLYKTLCQLTDVQKPDVIFTSGSTGFSPRDMMPEATKRAATKDAPGIAEALRAYSMTITPRAMLSRAASVIRNKTLIINMPGSPKAGKECLEYILPVLEHGIPVLRGEGDA